MKRVSKQRSRDNARYRKMRLKFLWIHAVCLRCRKIIPFSRRQIHHFYGRVGRLLTYEPGFHCACPECHTWIESHRNEAVKLGYRANDRLFNRPSLVIP